MENEEEIEENPPARCQKFWSCTSLLLLVWLLLTSFSITAVILVLLNTSQLPDFSEPHKGFETRGTVLASRASALANLGEASRSTGYLTGNPEGRRLLQGHLHRDPLIAWLPAKSTDGEDILAPIIGINRPHHTHTVDVSPENATKIFATPPDPQHNPLTPVNSSIPKPEAGSEHDGAIGRLAYDEENDDYSEEEAGAHEPMHTLSHLDPDHFCGQPTSGHARLIISHIKEGSNLWSLHTVRELCWLETQFGPFYKDICETYNRGRCCPSWSFSAFVALHANTTCQNLTQGDLDSLFELLQFCSPHFHNLTLECIAGQTCELAPQRCLHLDIVRSLMDFILDVGFLPPKATEFIWSDQVKYMQLILPIARSTRSYDFYQRLQYFLRSAKLEHIKVVAMDLGLKDFLFDKMILRDSIHLGVASLCVVCILLLSFVRSAAMVLLGMLTILLSIIISYWIYCEMLGADRFPFLNLLAGLLLLAVGTDDVLFIAQGWGERCDKHLHERLKGLKSLWISVTATSITTAAAMFAGTLSSVTSVTLFSIFAGSTMLIHLFMTLLWLLPSLVFVERLTKYTHFSACTGVSLPASLSTLLRRADTNLKAGLLWIVTRAPNYCVILTIAVTVSATYVTFVSPKLQAPDSRSFALFRSDHPFERYESDFSSSFWSDRRQHSARDILSLTWVWGVLAEDSRDPLDPQARPNATALQFDKSFDVTKPKAQLFLLRFCRQLKRQKFYRLTFGPFLPNCFLETLTTYMTRKCYDPIDNKDRKPCCEISKFPYPPRVLSLCLQRTMRDLHRTPAQFFMPGLAGPKYDVRTNVSETSAPVAIVVQFESSQKFSLSYKTMHSFFTEAEEWTQKMLRSAPRSMKSGFFVSDLQFYDLQLHLMSESLTAVITAASISCVVLYLATRNLVVTLLAVICVSTTILSSLATLALLGWRLNVLESLALTMATGLSVDYILHYAIKFNAHLEKEIRIKYLIHKNINPITVATLTTFLTGFILLTSDILAFNQIGTFIMVLSFNSYVFSNFAFLSFLYKFGPSYETDIEFCKRVWAVSTEVQDEANVTSQAPLSDSNSVTLTGLPPLSPELHEMENMSPTFLEDPTPRTVVFDTPVTAAVVSSNSPLVTPSAVFISNRSNARRSEVAILEPLLRQH